MYFIIPFRKDLNERYCNIKLVVDYIKSNFTHKILISELDTTQYLDASSLGTEYLFSKTHEKVFNKSKCINNAIDIIKDDVFCICDSDILFNIKSVNMAIKDLTDGKYDACLPYNGCVYNIKRINYINSTKNLEELKTDKLYSTESIGGIILMRMDSFLQSGKYNENFTGWGGEDYEIWMRIHKLGFNTHRYNGDLFHLCHFRFHPSRRMDLVNRNRDELEKIEKMNKYQIQKYYNIQC